MIPRAAAEIGAKLQEAGIEYELLFVNDGSRDATWPAIVLEAEKDSRVRGICFSRNFGKEAAMMAGLAKCRGDCAVVFDCDLQFPVEKIPEMYRLWEQGYEVVEGVKEDRGRESAIHRFFANTFYRIISSLTKMDMSNASDFRLLDRKVIDILNAMPERNTFFRALSSWVGFRTAKVKFSVKERQEGHSKWSSRALFNYAVTNIISFSAAPMQAVTVMGVIFLVIAVVLGIQSLVKKAMGLALEGFTTVILLELLVGSIIMISLGIVGCYIEKMYEELKGRPRYIISGETEAGDLKHERKDGQCQNCGKTSEK